MTPTHSRSLLLATALLATWVVWGSSFVAITWALESMPPLLLMATRFVAAGAIAVAVGWLLAHRAGHARPAARAWRDQAIVGAGFVVVGMGATSWAATRLSSAVTALLVATAPLWIVLLQLVASRGRSANAFALGGVAVGTAGVAVLVSPGGGGGIDAVAAGVLVLANAIWAGTTIFATRAARPEGLLLAVGMQMLLGGAMLGLVALAVGEGRAWSFGAIGGLAAGSWTYLVLAASLGGFLAYGWLLRHASASLASTHAFVNPVVAVALGALLLGEAVDARMLAAGGAVIGAVVLLLVGERRVPAATSVAAGQPPARRPRRTRIATASAARPALARGGGRRPGWSPAPTPSFARRTPRPWQATDGMDALAIDEALDRLP